MDEFTRTHLDAWLKNSVHPNDRAALRAKIVHFAEEYPDILARSSWPEIRELVERQVSFSQKPFGA